MYLNRYVCNIYVLHYCVEYFVYANRLNSRNNIRSVPNILGVGWAPISLTAALHLGYIYTELSQCYYKPLKSTWDRTLTRRAMMPIFRQAISRAVRIQLFTAQVLCRSFVKYSSTRLIPKLVVNYRWSKTDGCLVPHSYLCDNNGLPEMLRKNLLSTAVTCTNNAWDESSRTKLIGIEIFICFFSNFKYLI